MSINYTSYLRKRGFRGIESVATSSIAPQPVLRKVPSTNQTNTLSVIGDGFNALGEVITDAGARIRAKDWAEESAKAQSSFLDAMVRAELDLDINDPASHPGQIGASGNQAIQEIIGPLAERFGPESSEVKGLSQKFETSLSTRVAKQTLKSHDALGAQGLDKIELFAKDQLRKFGGSPLSSDQFTTAHTSLQEMFAAYKDKISQVKLADVERKFLEDWEDRYYEGVAASTDYASMKQILDIYDGDDEKAKRALFLYTQSDDNHINALRTAFGRRDKEYKALVGASVDQHQKTLEGLVAQASQIPNLPSQWEPPSFYGSVPDDPLLTSVVEQMEVVRDMLESKNVTSVLTGAKLKNLSSQYDRLASLEFLLQRRMLVTATRNISGIDNQLEFLRQTIIDAGKNKDSLFTKDQAKFLNQDKSKVLETFAKGRKNDLGVFNRFARDDGNQKDLDHILQKTATSDMLIELAEAYGVFSDPESSRILMGLTGEAFGDVIKANLVVEGPPDSKGQKTARVGWGVDWWVDTYNKTGVLDRNILQNLAQAFIETRDAEINITAAKLAALAIAIDRGKDRPIDLHMLKQYVNGGLSVSQFDMLSVLNDRKVGGESPGPAAISLADRIIRSNNNPIIAKELSAEFEKYESLIAKAINPSWVQRNFSIVAPRIDDPVLSQMQATFQNLYFEYRMSGAGMNPPDAADAALEGVKRTYGVARIGFGGDPSGGRIVRDPLDRLVKQGYTPESVKNALAYAVGLGLGISPGQLPDQIGKGTFTYLALPATRASRGGVTTAKVPGKDISMAVDDPESALGVTVVNPNEIPMVDLAPDVLNSYEIVDQDDQGITLRISINLPEQRPYLDWESASRQMGEGTIPLVRFPPRREFFPVGTRLMYKDKNGRPTDRIKILWAELDRDERGDWVEDVSETVERGSGRVLRWVNRTVRDGVESLWRGITGTDSTGAIQEDTKTPQEPDKKSSDAASTIFQNTFSATGRNTFTRRGDFNIFGLTAGKEWAGVTSKTGKGGVEDFSNFANSEFAWRTFFRLARNYIRGDIPGGARKNTLQLFVTHYTGDRDAYKHSDLIQAAVENMPGIDSANDVLSEDRSTLINLAYMTIIQEGLIQKSKHGVTVSQFVNFLRDKEIPEGSTVLTDDLHNALISMMNRALESSKVSMDNTHWKP